MTPLPEHTDPRSGFRFVASYTRTDGGTHTVDIWARDMEHAQAEVFMIKNTLKLDGQVMAREDMEGGLN